MKLSRFCAILYEPSPYFMTIFPPKAGKNFSIVI